MAESNDRPKVGEADLETRRRMLREKLDEPSKPTGVAPKPQPEMKPKKKKGFVDSLKDALDPSKPRELRRGEEGKTIMEAVEQGIEEGDKENRVKRK